MKFIPRVAETARRVSALASRSRVAGFTVKKNHGAGTTDLGTDVPGNGMEGHVLYTVFSLSRGCLVNAHAGAQMGTRSALARSDPHTARGPVPHW